MRARLLRFRVTRFKSVSDSGWLDSGPITCLIGTNESGKTNLLLPLWKLKPANGEPLVPLTDYPRSLYIDYSQTKGREVFITADFALDEQTANSLGEKLGCWGKRVALVRVSRRYDGSYDIGFPEFHDALGTRVTEFRERLVRFANTLSNIPYEYKAKSSLKDDLLTVLHDASLTDAMKDSDVYRICESLSEFGPESLPKGAADMRAFLDELLDYCGSLRAEMGLKEPQVSSELVSWVVAQLPSFVYYADYGNLDSEIYLPHVINNLTRNDLGVKERAKARTLKVLFDFVRLNPQQILDLGKETGSDPAGITSDATKKKEREILLQSASTKLTADFLNWWRQGDYRFRFQADGNHFRIWVSDKARPEEVELESRSRGLQWFFSFFLVFLVESQQDHSDSVLLLDEPGLTLHPVAQQDLMAFFESLSQKNQLIYSTHSPFLVDFNHLEQVRAVYVDGTGHTATSADLRIGEQLAKRSVYPVHAALGLTVSETLLLGTTPVIVEGTSDQIYLTLIKLYLAAHGLWDRRKELVFIPSGGVKGITPVVSILQGRDDVLPRVIIDSDRQGAGKAASLKSGTYKDQPDRVINIADVMKLAEAETEDLLPPRLVARSVSRLAAFRDAAFEDTLVAGAIVPQIESFFVRYNLPLEKGWKVDLARAVAGSFDRYVEKEGLDELSRESWKSLFAALVD